MNIYIIAVGRMKKSAEYDLLKTYLKRCPWDIRIIEVEEKRPLKAGPRMKREGELLLKAIPQSAIIIALDERGEKTIGEFGHHDKVLLVMGAEGKGLRPSVRDHCTDVARIEMLGPLASINVSNAAAISFYALMGGK